MGIFQLESNYQLKGDQPQAVEALAAGVQAGLDVYKRQANKSAATHSIRSWP